MADYITREQVEEMFNKHEENCQKILPLTYIQTPKPWKIIATLGTVFVFVVGGIAASLGIYYTDTRDNRENIQVNNIRDIAQDSSIIANRRQIEELSGNVRDALDRQTQAFNKMYAEMQRRRRDQE